MSDLTLLDPTDDLCVDHDFRWELSDLHTVDAPPSEPAPPLPVRAKALKAPRIMALRPGDRVPGTPYVVLRCIGQGGMGEVYEVELPATNIHGALKVLHPKHRERDDLVARMWREGRVLSAIEHPGVVRLLDLGEIADGRPFVVMELLEGRDLREVLTSAGPMPVDGALRLIADALDGLSAVHAAGIVHRDIKLENLFLCWDGRVKVIDFGVAKARWAETSPTFPGFVPGTPRTMAPEQCAQRGVDPRADLYAVGLALYELCAGRGPFDDLRDQPQALRFAHCTRTPPSPAELASQPIPAEVQAAILRAIAKSPADRFQSAVEMAAALRSLIPRRPAIPATGNDHDGGYALRAMRSAHLPATTRRLRRRRAATRRGVRRPSAMSFALLLLFFALGLLLGHVLAPHSRGHDAPPLRVIDGLSADRCKRPSTTALSWPNEDGRT